MHSIYKIIYGKHILWYKKELFLMRKLRGEPYKITVIGSNRELNQDEVAQFFYSIDRDYDLGVDYYRRTGRFTGIQFQDVAMFQLSRVLWN